jgi:preprotein translocase subunit SecA
MFDDFLSNRDAQVRSASNTEYLKKLAARVDRINALEPTIEELADDELLQKTIEFRQRIQKGEDVNGPLLEEAFAVVREAAWYVHGSMQPWYWMTNTQVVQLCQ